LVEIANQSTKPCDFFLELFFSSHAIPLLIAAERERSPNEQLL
jgi:hypothetical protein